MKKCIGIDLGTTNSVVTFKDAKLKTIRNRHKKASTPSVVVLKDDAFIVGEDAKMGAPQDAERTVFSVKRLIGGAMNDEDVQQFINSEACRYQVQEMTGGTEDSLSIVIDANEYSPAELSAEILKELKSAAEDYLKGEVSHAVITVPANFTEKQKTATKRAAELAGLSVLKLLSEPTAAAISFGITEMDKDDMRSVLVYDFGGGTFDLSLLNIVDGNFIESGTGGDRWLGGADIDDKLYSLVLDKVAEEYGFTDIKSVFEKLPKMDRLRIEVELLLKVEQAKISLSANRNADIYIDSAFKDEDGDLVDIDVTVSRDELENIVRPLITESIRMVYDLIKESGTELELVDTILLAGGTTNIPLVYDMLSEEFGSDKVVMSKNPMTAIAEGAGVFAHSFDESAAEEEKAVVSSIANHDLFIKLKSGFDKVIEKQSPLPATVIKTYRTTYVNQQIIELDFYNENEQGKKIRQTLGYMTLEGDLPEGTEVVFDFQITEDDILFVSAYPKNAPQLKEPIRLSRGEKDAKAFELLGEVIRKSNSDDYSDFQRAKLTHGLRQLVDEMNLLGSESPTSDKWVETGRKIFELPAGIEDDAIDDEQLTQRKAEILVGHFSEFINDHDLNKMNTGLSTVRTSNDLLEKMEAFRSLEILVDQYSFFTSIFLIKIAGEKAASRNPSDSQRLGSYYGQIIDCLRRHDADGANSNLNSAWPLAEKYLGHQKGPSGPPQIDVE